jgi:large subunit ribosomal protein L7/L12
MASKTHEKFIEEIGKMSVLELAELVKALETEFGVSAAMPVAAAGAPAVAGAGAAAAEEKTQFKVTLKDSGAEKIKVIKALRQVVQGLSLTDAKKMVEEAPSVVVEAASKDDAQKIKKELEAAGAVVELA